MTRVFGKMQVQAWTVAFHLSQEGKANIRLERLPGIGWQVRHD